MITEPKPLTHVLYYVDNAAWEKEAARVGPESADPFYTEKQLDAISLHHAQFLRQYIEDNGIGLSVRIYRRVGVYAVTSLDGEYTQWEWDEELVED